MTHGATFRFYTLKATSRRYMIKATSRLYTKGFEDYD